MLPLKFEAKSSSLDFVDVLTPGSGYKFGDIVNFDNEGTGGSDAAGFVSVLKGQPITTVTKATFDYLEYANDFGSFDMIGSSTLAPWAIVIVDTWMWTPFTMLICLAGLRSIPNYLYEAAEVDRANRLQQFIYITLPSVLPFLLLALLFRGIENFKMFDMVVELTSGGPGSATELASIQLKREAFEKWKTGYSSAYAVILFVTIFGFGNVYVKVMNKIKDR